jgi:uncharacterized membrane protein YgcG
VKKRRPEEVLEEYLNERTIPDDPELASLSRMADRLERGLNVDAPESPRERALFIQGVAARKPGFPWGRILVPITAASLLVAFVAISREAGPGDALYGVRKALDKVGLAENPARSARPLLDEAEELLVRAENFLDEENYRAARQTALRAVPYLDEASELLEDGSGEFASEQSDRLEDLYDEANDIIVEAIERADDREEAEQRAERREEAAERAEERQEEREDRQEDNSGPGGGGGDGDDNSGPGGGGDDGGGGDSSGSGGGGGDSSGSGSGSDSGGSGSG